MKRTGNVLILSNGDRQILCNNRRVFHSLNNCSVCTITCRPTCRLHVGLHVYATSTEKYCKLVSFGTSGASHQKMLSQPAVQQTYKTERLRSMNSKNGCDVNWKLHNVMSFSSIRDKFNGEEFPRDVFTTRCFQERYQTLDDPPKTIEKTASRAMSRASDNSSWTRWNQSETLAASRYEKLPEHGLTRWQLARNEVTLTVVAVRNQ